MCSLFLVIFNFLILFSLPQVAVVVVEDFFLHFIVIRKINYEISGDFKVGLDQKEHKSWRLKNWNNNRKVSCVESFFCVIIIDYVFWWNNPKRVDEKTGELLEFKRSKT